MSRFWIRERNEAVTQHPLKTWLIRLFVIVVLFPVCLVLLGSAMTRYKCMQVKMIGGSVQTGPPIKISERMYDRRTPKAIRNFCSSRLGRWTINLFPTIYGIDLRGIEDPSNVEFGIRVAQKCPELRELTLYRSAVTDNHLKILTNKFSKLARLKLNETNITDAGIRHLKHVPSLEMVNAQRTLITNASMQEFAQLNKLKVLMIAETEIASTAEFQKLKPYCRLKLKIETKTRCKQCRKTLGDCICNDSQVE